MQIWVHTGRLFHRLHIYRPERACISSRLWLRTLSGIFIHIKYWKIRVCHCSLSIAWGLLQGLQRTFPTVTLCFTKGILLEVTSHYYAGHTHQGATTAECPRPWPASSFRAASCGGGSEGCPAPGGEQCRTSHREARSEAMMLCHTQSPKP